MQQNSDHGPLEAKFEAEARLQELGRLLSQYFREFKTRDGRPYGFALLFFPLGDNKPGDRTNYLSNAERTSMLSAMKEFIARAEGRYFE